MTTMILLKVKRMILKNSEVITMKKKELLKQLEEIREIIAWNDIEDCNLTDATREKVMIGIDDIVEKINENYED